MHCAQARLNLTRITVHRLLAGVDTNPSGRIPRLDVATATARQPSLPAPSVRHYGCRPARLPA